MSLELRQTLVRKFELSQKAFNRFRGGVLWYICPCRNPHWCKTVLAIFACNNLHCDQMDVVTAFLNGDLNEEIYMETPSCFRDPSQPNLFCRLSKNIYGLKQSPKKWYAKINSFLVNELNFKECISEPCLYLKHSSYSILAIILYVDDLLIAGRNEPELLEIKEEYKLRFHMKYLGPTKEFLGIQIHRNNSNLTLSISQTAYVRKKFIALICLTPSHVQLLWSSSL